MSAQTRDPLPGATLAWLLGGEAEAAVESLVSLEDGRICGRRQPPLPRPLAGVAAAVVR